MYNGPFAFKHTDNPHLPKPDYRNNQDLPLWKIADGVEVQVVFGPGDEVRTELGVSIVARRVVTGVEIPKLKEALDAANRYLIEERVKGLMLAIGHASSEAGNHYDPAMDETQGVGMYQPIPPTWGAFADQVAASPSRHGTLIDMARSRWTVSKRDSPTYRSTGTCTTGSST